MQDARVMTTYVLAYTLTGRAYSEREVVISRSLTLTSFSNASAKLVVRSTYTIYIHV